jgi:tetratricopeptide (TPR) repeat protein
VRSGRDRRRLRLEAIAGLPGVLVCLLASGSSLSGAASGAEIGRREALSALAGQADVDVRRRGALALAEHGVLEDVPALIAALRDRDPLVRAFAENAVWRVWSRSGDAEVDRLFAVGVEQMSQRHAAAAVETFTRIIERRPDFAEGWNKRATVYYLLGEYERSLADCVEVMQRNPHHFGALSGFGMIYLQLNDPARALEHFERALRINPNLPQVEETVETLRALLVKRRKDSI